MQVGPSSAGWHNRVMRDHAQPLLVRSNMPAELVVLVVVAAAQCPVVIVACRHL